MDPPVRPASDAVIDRADIGARTTANTLEHFATDRIFENIGTTVIEKHQVEFFRAKFAFRAAWTGDELCVSGKFLSCGRTRQQFEKHGERFPIGDHFVNANDGHMQVGHGRAHAPVAFIGDHHERTRLSDQEIRARNTHLCFQKFLAQDFARAIDVLDEQIERRDALDEAFFQDKISQLETLRQRIRTNLESTLGLGIKVNLVEPKTIERFEGKSKRVIDKRKY